MHLVLSHSNTDFDGLAAQLAAVRLFAGALALLNPQLNQRVKAFLALAQEELPFVTLQQLPQLPVSQLTLVDTQQLPHLPLLPVQPVPTMIIDHHPQSRQPAANEQLILAETGATTTMLVERLIDANLSLTAVEATLLLLGIYEGTGNLTLAGTRQNDLLAAGWLLGQRAQLAAIGEFLTRPLLEAQQITPALTAADLMTRQVWSVPVHATIAEAAAIQLRSGHSVLPVVDEVGSVQGLIGRKELDRATQHGLGAAPLRRYMWRGPHYVAPNTPLAELRYALLEDEGRITGRLLVVDAQKRLLGIVTRADLLRAWVGTTPMEGQSDHSSALAQFVSPAILALLQEAGQIAESHGWLVYLVGGTVRDLLLGRSASDLDLVVEGQAIGLAQALAERYRGRLRSHAQFGTATLELAIGDFDLVTARSEFYERPAALPAIEAASLRLDLHRRDFTINTLAICLNPSRYGRLYDFYSGQRDLERRLIRVLHNLSFIDDPTRMLRAARLATRLGCTIEPRTHTLIADALEHHMLARITPQRIWNELLLIFSEPNVAETLALLWSLGVLAAIDPALTWQPEMAAWYQAARQEETTNQVDLGLALLLIPLAATAQQRIVQHYQANADQLALISDLGRLASRITELASPTLAASRIDQLLHGLADPALLAGAMTYPASVATAIRRYRSELRPIQLEVNGDDLKALGLTPGPQFRSLLAGLRAARLDGLVTTHSEQLAWVRRQVN